MRLLSSALLALLLVACSSVHETAPERGDVSVEVGVADVPPIHLRSVRVPVSDVEVGAAFYREAFGMKEIRRLGTGRSLQIVMNTGDTVEAATANPRSPLVIVNRPEGLEVGGLAALIISVPDVDAVLADVVEAGGTVVRPKVAIPDGPTFGFVKDPEGNQLELLLSE